MTNTGYATQQTTNAGTLILTVMAILLALSLSPLAATKPASASIFYTLYTVNSTDDAPDLDPGDGLCDVNLLVLGEQCTLRAAIQESNASAGAAIIDFDIPGKGVHTIHVNSSGYGELPVITDTVTIDGYTQRPCSTNPAPCSSPNTLAKGTNAKLMVQLDGSAAPVGSTGLEIISPDVEVKGLVVGGFSHGIQTNGATNSKIEGNFIGTDPSGTSAQSNLSGGVSLFGENSSVTVGGASPAASNLISGNGAEGILIIGHGNEVSGNLIGTQKDGKSPLGNSDDGVDIQSNNVASSSENTVGRTDPAYGNTIAFNGDSGVDIYRQSAGGTVLSNSVLSNSVFSNESLGIDLGDDGATPNDIGDADTGANNLQNNPVLSSAKKSATGKTTIKGKLNSTPNQTFNIQFFKNPKGTNEGKKLLFSKPVTTDGTGTVSFTFATKKKVKVGQNVTATATNSATKDTSEFSAPRKVVKS